jgi:O-antigen biosynthesis protein
MPQVSIITAVFNGLSYTRPYLDSLRASLDGVDWELVLVDDASTDDTREFLESLASDSRIRCLFNGRNRGYAVSNNRGAAAARGEVLAFLNNDLLLRPGWFQSMEALLNESEQPGAIGNIQIQATSGLVDHAGVFFGLDGMPRQARKNTRLIPKQAYTEWHAVTAACMVIRPDVFRAAGGFDEGYLNGFEDIDLCVRLRTKGYRNYVANLSKVIHHVSVSPGRHRHNDANSVRFSERWSETTRLWGQREWAPEYLKRYSHQWWKFNAKKLLLALRMVWDDRNRKHLIHR